MMLERRCMQVIKKVEWLKGSLLSFLSLLRAIIVSLIILNIHVTRFKKEFPCIWAIFWVQCMHRLSGKPLTSTKGPPHLLLFFYLQTHHCVLRKISWRCGGCRSLLSQKRARLKVQLHFSSLNIMYSVLEFVMPSYFWCVIFQNALVCELLRGLTHQFSIGHSLIRCEVLVPRSCRRENLVDFWNIHTQSRPLYFGFWESMQNQAYGLFQSSVLKATISDYKRTQT